MPSPASLRAASKKAALALALVLTLAKAAACPPMVATPLPPWRAFSCAYGATNAVPSTPGALLLS